MLILYKVLFLYLNLLLVFISSLGYGLLFKNLIFKNNNHNNIFEIYIFSIPPLLFIGLLLHLFFPINYLITSLVLIIGFLLFTFTKKKNLFDKNSLFIGFFLILTLFPLLIGSTENGDFYYHHLPYLNLINEFKIIFGLVNFNDVLANPYMSWFNYSGLFALPPFKYQFIFLLNFLFFFSFIGYLYLDLKKNDQIDLKIIDLFLILISISIFSKIKNHGTDVPPQLFILLSFRYFYSVMMYQNKHYSEYLVRIILFLTVAIIFRINSIFIIPLMTVTAYLFLKNLANLKKYLISILFIFFLSLGFFSKNLINTGCAIYPINFICFDNKIEWAISKEITSKRMNLLEASSKGWMYYAKSVNPTSNKFVWNESENLLKHDEYINKGIKFWFKYWKQDHDYKRILNILIIYFFIILILLSLNKFKLKRNKPNSSRYIFIISIIFLCVVFWFLKTPQTRFAGFSLIVSLCTIGSIWFISFFETGSKTFINKFSKILLIITLIINAFENKPNMINNFIEKNNSSFLTWTEYPKLIENIDFEKININNININLRKHSEVLYAGNIKEENNYILFCGNISQLCIPENKINCFKNIKEKYGYYFFYPDYKRCREIIDKNIIY
ncbi:hypothetical protein OAI01_05145 [Alphaproteobacteria bacterium]|nr:hypothetical protein [Alphaproteobacteria bacterium]